MAGNSKQHFSLNSKDLVAVGAPVDDVTSAGFIVLSGARFNKHIIPWATHYVGPLRDRMMSEGVLDDEGDTLRLTRDYEFDSSDQAASVLLGILAVDDGYWIDSVDAGEELLVDQNTPAKWDEAGLRDLIQSDRRARRFFQSIASRQRNPKQTKFTMLRSYAFSSKEAKKFLVKLDELGCGTRIIGRRGHRTRLVWTVHAIDVANRILEDPVECSDTPDLQQTPFSEIDTASEQCHTFALRSDFEAELRLPKDITSVEALRIATFVIAIPKDGQLPGNLTLLAGESGHTAGGHVAAADSWNAEDVDLANGYHELVDPDELQ